MNHGTGTENVDGFVLNWHGENNYICSPVFLIPRVLRHTMNCRAVGYYNCTFLAIFYENPTDYNPFLFKMYGNFPQRRILSLWDSDYRWLDHVT